MSKIRFSAFKIATSLTVAAGTCAPTFLAPALATPNMVSVAQSPRLTASDKQVLLGKLAAAGIDRDTSDLLIDKLEKGELWDSMNPGAKPISSNTLDASGHTTTTEIFADGSRTISSIEKPRAVNPTDSALRSGGVEIVDCGRYFPDVTGMVKIKIGTNCLAKKDFILMSMEFKYDFAYNARSKTATINKYYSPVLSGIGLTFDNQSFEQPHSNTVRLSADYTVLAKGFPVKQTAWIQVDILQGTPFLSWN